MHAQTGHNQTDRPIRGAVIMHEIDYAMELLEKIEEAAKKSENGRVVLVKVRLGLARGISSAALRATFDWIKPDTIAEHTGLEIEVVPIQIHCTLCDEVYTTRQALDECPHCGSLGGEIVKGNEFDVSIQRIEKNTPVPHRPAVGW
jgi:hydrogenase nickel incorporation protein HypA/HybF